MKRDVKKDMEIMSEKVGRIKELKENVKLGGGLDKIEKQHGAGRLTARERIERLFDPDSFVELDMLARPLGRDFGADKVYAPGDGIIIGCGTVNGKQVAAFAQDFTVVAGTMGEMHGKKMVKIIHLAAQWGMPLVGLCESGGLRLQEFLAVSRTFGELFYANSIYSGVIPQIVGLFGAIAGGQTYSPGLMDFVFMTRDAVAFIAGPPLVASVIGEEISAEELGGAAVHSTVSGFCHVISEDDGDCIEGIKELLGYLPQNNWEEQFRLSTGDPPERISEKLYEIVPPDPRVPFDMHEVIHEVADNGKFFEIHKAYCPNIIVGFSRFDGYSVGIIANNSLYKAGSIDCKAAEKAARFIRFCDAFNIPLLYLVSTPAYLIGSQQEREGIIYRGATLLYATSEATVPKIAVEIGWAYAGSFIAMGSKYLGGDIVYAWPNAQVGSVAAEGVVDVIFRKQISSAEDPKQERMRRIEEFEKTYMDITYPAGYQHIDDVIDPKETRPKIIRALKALRSKKQELPRKKHGCMPL